MSIKKFAAQCEAEMLVASQLADLFREITDTDPPTPAERDDWEDREAMDAHYEYEWHGGPDA